MNIQPNRQMAKCRLVGLLVLILSAILVGVANAAKANTSKEVPATVHQPSAKKDETGKLGSILKRSVPAAAATQKQSSTGQQFPVSPAELAKAQLFCSQLSSYSQGIRFKKSPFEEEGIRYKKSPFDEEGIRYKKASPFADEGIRYKKAMPFAEEGIRFKKSPFDAEGIRFKKSPFDDEEGIRYKKAMPFAEEGIRFKKAMPFAEEGIRFKKASPFADEGIRYKKAMPFADEGIRFKKSPFDAEGIRF